ncbi:BamA/TamA family outer membrane protein [Echinicola shivajiensis]|uniref:BamA/TamA family outer membrane protein n=1 Tax=Echinicola shivajiensis TaxID=1035916 RepID=UPI001BFC353A|nr:BamA/TamA family outer membrane protein [Echinicola shivajiensis]
MKRTLLLITVLIFSSRLIFAQEVKKDSLNKSSLKEENSTQFKVMPFFSYNRNLKFMFGAIPMLMYKLDKQDSISPKSLSGAAGVYTTNGSHFISVFNRFFLKEDKWRIIFFGLTGNHTSQFFMDDFQNGSFYDYNSNTTIVTAGVRRRVFNDIFLGLNYTYSHYYTVYEDEVLPNETTSTNALEYIISIDTRNDVYYPNKGNQVKVKWVSLPEWFGNDLTSNKIKTEYNQYFSTRDGEDVFAARYAGNFGLGNIVFEQQEVLGGKDIRGYSEGKYRGDGLIAFQGEYRYNFHPKMGLVGFAGLATIYGSDNPDFDWNIYPGGGIGYRYRAFKDVKFNIGLDAAVGKDDWGIYFRIGEAF